MINAPQALRPQRLRHACQKHNHGAIGTVVGPLADLSATGLAARRPIVVNRAPVLTLWAAVVAEWLGHSRDTELTLGRAVAGSSARIKARNIGCEERQADRNVDMPQLALEHIAEFAPAEEAIKLVSNRRMC